MIGTDSAHYQTPVAHVKGHWAPLSRQVSPTLALPMVRLGFTVSRSRRSRRQLWPPTMGRSVGARPQFDSWISGFDRILWSGVGDCAALPTSTVSLHSPVVTHCWQHCPPFYELFVNKQLTNSIPNTSSNRLIRPLINRWFWLRVSIGHRFCTSHRFDRHFGN